MGSLQEALFKSGLVDEEKSRQARRSPGKPGKKKAGSGKGSSAGKGAGGEKPRMARKKKTGRKGSGDLASAYAARKRAEEAEKERKKQARVADQEKRRKRNLELDKLVEGRILNDEQAEIPRYFEHLGKIRRVMVTPQQRQAINEGQLGVVGLRGRYLVVDPETYAAYKEKAGDLVPDLSGKEPEGDDGGDYPPVPDDLAW